jgi:hypothetical protein
VPTVAVRKARSSFVVAATVLYSLLVVCGPSGASGSSWTAPPSTEPPKNSAPPPDVIGSQVHYARSYQGGGTTMHSSDVAWSPPPCWYEPAYSPDQMEAYLHANYQAEHIAQEVIGQDQDAGINYHTGEKGAWWKLMISDDLALAQGCHAEHSWLWVKPDTPATPDLPVIDPATLAGLAYNHTTLPGPPVTLRPAPENQLVNVDTQVTFDQPLARVWVTARIDNAVAGVHIAATTVATPTRLRVDAGTGYAEPRTCTYDLTPKGGAYTVDTRNDSCNVTYRKASAAGGSYPLTASIVWKVTWTPSADPNGPPAAAPTLPDGESTTTSQVTVRENQAVNRR